jgi:hypothetical protein
MQSVIINVAISFIYYIIKTIEKERLRSNLLNTVYDI